MREALRRAASNHWDEMRPEQANSAWWRYQSNAGCFDPRMFETHWFDKFCAYDCLCKFRWRKEFSCWNSDRKIRSWKAVQEVSPVLRAAAEAEKTALGPRWSAVPWNIGMVVNFSDSSNSGCVWNSAGFLPLFFRFQAVAESLATGKPLKDTRPVGFQPWAWLIVCVGMGEPCCLHKQCMRMQGFLNWKSVQESTVSTLKLIFLVDVSPGLDTAATLSQPYSLSWSLLLDPDVRVVWRSSHGTCPSFGLWVMSRML